MNNYIVDCLKRLDNLELQEIENLLIGVYRNLDSTDDNDYNTCLSAICHIANLSIKDVMIQQLLHDCIIKSRIFLYDNLLEINDETYNPNYSIQDMVLKNIYTSGLTNTTLTRPQKEIFSAFQTSKRLIVSAPTSFGKTRIVREIIAHNEYKNIALIMPTVSLLSEQYQDIKNATDGYVISKSSKVEIDESKSYILILTPERMSAFLEENPDFKVDFFVMDEIYKVDYKLDDDRFRVFSDILYRLAKTDADFYLIGPYITDFSQKFRDKFDVKMLRYDTEIVQKDYYSLDFETERRTHLIEKSKIKIIKDKFKNLLRIVSEESIDGKFLIYRYQKQYVEDTANKFVKLWPVKEYNKELVNYLEDTVSSNWDLIPCLKRGIAFHHGAMPRHVQDLIVDEFNTKEPSGIDYLFCTTSLTEGINSAAKNVVLFDKKIGAGESLKTLDRKNIEGRAGRFMQHFIGRVFHLEQPEDGDLETSVEVEFFDNNDPAIESLIQLEDDDIDDDFSERYESHLKDIDMLNIPNQVLKENKFVNVDSQIELINHLRTLPSLEKYYFEEQIPSKEYLNNILTTIYNFLFTQNDIGRNFDGEVGQSILIGLTKYYVYFSPSFKVLLQSDTVQNARKKENARIRYVFDLMSKYFEFVWPKYLKSFQNIYNFVAKERSQKPIDVSMLIAKLEYGTTENHEIIMRDSGLPNEIVKKISHRFKGCENFEDVVIKANIIKPYLTDELRPIEMRVLNKYL
ncbi:DEAD/DEAH box helicase domain protein [Vibrio coralliirubri]|uniref:DEAD/DEAH box helicase n=1 Tax=Vibrio coralliirubri TaxID=1516159 RepID=UPI0006377D85|nr:DEAD/DEAH box helicase [Vibrio coralliirubri]CDU07953.1 DEAD/DEAH box helicase domain protein [Vibrio coralliirubri]